MASSLIQPERDFTLWAVLLLAAAIGFWAERTRWGAKLSGAVVTILVTFILSNLRIIPVSSPTYDVIWSVLVPLAIPLLLFKADLLRIFQETGFILVAYLLGIVGTVIGTIGAYYLLPLGKDNWQWAGVFCATYIGGGMNFVPTARILGLHSEDLLNAGVAANNLVMTSYLVLLFALPSIKWIRRIFPTKRSYQTIHTGQINLSTPQTGETLRLVDISLSLSISALVCAGGYGVADWLGLGEIRILMITALMVALATIFPHDLEKIRSADKVGMLLLQVFFAAIGASANIEAVLAMRPIFFFFAALIVAIHLLILLLAGRLLRLELVELAIASNANTGGPTTAAAMAKAKEWDKLIVPGIVCGTLGYTIATFIGVSLGHFLR
ncbi:DUF819 family protein [Pleurocapsales cyanobacterium LEGE 06147]|nr:DUF819 family protein [Pleurocapsales cyanobacterium LEGE 06147]